MEVGNKRVDHMVGRTRHEVEVRRRVLPSDDIAHALHCRAGSILEPARDNRGLGRGCLSVPRALKRAHRRRAHGDHAVPRRLGGVHGIYNRLRHVIALGMHDVLGGIVLLHKAEGVDPHLKLDRRPTDPLLLDALDELGREVESGRGSRGGMLLAHGVDGLVLLGVSFVIGDIGRQRHVPRGMDRLVERARRARCVLALRCEAHETPAAAIGHEVKHFPHKYHGRAFGRVRTARAVFDDRTGLEALARTHKAFPHMAERILVLATGEQERLGHTARLRLAPDEARRHHAGLVRHEQVARLEVVDDVVEVTVLHATAMSKRHGLARGRKRFAAVQHQQAARIARLRRCLGYELLGQVVIEIIGTHGYLAFLSG